MTERLLQFIWQFQYFNRQFLLLESGEPFEIIHPGAFNSNQGPDFQEARIRIGNTLWAGHVELHIKASDWRRHRHTEDRNYGNVILHVVWENDLAGAAGAIPVFSLRDRVPKVLLQQYEDWLNNGRFIPCGRQARTVSKLVWASWKERLLAERLQRKASIVYACLLENNQHWDETCWWLLARNFGITVNAATFECIARSLPLNLLSKHKNQLHQLEALLLGQAGLLENHLWEDYGQMLIQEYAFYRKKYQLDPVRQPVHFLRMRPSSFPTVRLAQLAMLVHTSAHLFSSFKETATLTGIRNLLSVTASSFWDNHYNFGELARYMPKKLGSQMIDNIIINTVVPLVFAWGQLHGEPLYTERTLQWLEEIGAENNTITSSFKGIGIGNHSAFDSQALIELKTMYCDQKKCLDCAVGNMLLKHSVTAVKLRAV